MTGEELRRARVTLGAMWGLPRPLHCAELGRALRMAQSDPGESIRAYERNRQAPVPGPVAAAVGMMLGGALPPGGLASLMTEEKLRSLHRSVRGRRRARA